MSKKKYYIFLLVLLFIMLLGMFSSCYARTTLTDDEAEYVFEYLLGSAYNSQIVNSGYYNFSDISIPSYLIKSNLSTSFNNFKNYFNANNTIDIDPNTTVFWFRLDPGSSYRIYFGNFNNGKVDNLPFLNLKFGSSYSGYKSLQINAINDNKQAVDFSFSCINGTVSNGVLNFTTKTDFTIGPSYSNTSSNSKFYVGSNIWNANYSYPVTDCLPGLVTFKSTNSIYMNWDGTNSFNEPKAFLIKSLFVDNTPEPEPEPEPDNNGTGTITNNSGDKTGSIDLSGIETGLSNIQNQISGDSQKIINQISGDNVKIVNAINNSNQNYWGSSGDLTGDEQIDAIEDNLNNLMSSLSGDITQNQIFEQLEGAEDGFLNFFRSQNDEQWYDLAFEWNDVYYQGVVLIKAGNINISKMCREIPELGNIQAIIRTIFNFSCAIALICQIYNLILSTLGIDNPYLYEDGAEVTSIDTDTGEYRQRYIKRRRKL